MMWFARGPYVKKLNLIKSLISSFYTLKEVRVMNEVSYLNPIFLYLVEPTDTLCKDVFNSG